MWGFLGHGESLGLSAVGRLQDLNRSDDVRCTEVTLASVCRVGGT